MADLSNILTPNQSADDEKKVHATDAAAEPPPKRARVHAACENCRNRKTRCDGQRPICAACVKRKVGNTCTYERQPRKTQSLSLDEGLTQQRSFMLEAPAATAKRSSEQPTLLNPIDARYTEQLSSSNGDSRRNTAALSALALVQSGGDDNSYGSSSTIAFLNTISAENSSKFDEQARSSSKETPRLAKTTVPVRTLSHVPEKLTAASSAALFPRRREADDYIRYYWELVHPVWPLLHRPTFMDQYERMWASERDADQTEFEETLFTSALNLVFAIGCKYTPNIPKEHKISMSNEFYQRSRTMFCYDVLDAASLSMVQLLLLTVIYLQSTQHANRCWNTLGLAIRAAQSIGLHVEPPDRSQSQLQLEMHRRIWHCCVTLDRLLAMVFGRPAVIRKSIMPIPSLVDDEFLRNSGFGQQPKDSIPQLGLFIYSCNLFDVLEDILGTLYADQAAHKPALKRADQVHVIKTLDNVVQLNRRLDDLEVSLPAWMRYNADDRDLVPSHIRIQQQVLHCRFLYVRLLCTRPLLLMTTRRGDGKKRSTLDDALIRQSAEQCVGYAHELIEVMYNRLSDLYRNSSWHTTYFACGALMVLLASIKSNSQLERLESSWENAISILNHHKGEVSSATEGIRILQEMKQRLWKPQNHAEALANGHIITQPYGTPRTPSSMFTPTTNLDFAADIMDFMDLDNISDAWFSQHLLDSGWLDFNFTPSVAPPIDVAG